VPAHRDENADRATLHLLDCLDSIRAVFARRIEIEFISEFFHERLVHPLADSHRAIALDVRMPAYRTRSGSRPADIPAEQEEIHDLLDCRDCISMLGQSHGPATNDAFRTDRDLGRDPDLFPRYADTDENFIPDRRIQILDKTVVACGEIIINY